jgi:hypothetical protein
MPAVSINTEITFEYEINSNCSASFVKDLPFLVSKHLSLLVAVSAQKNSKWKRAPSLLKYCFLCFFANHGRQQANQSLLEALQEAGQ